MGFRIGKFNYFLGINQFSDRTSKELRRMHSGVKLGEDFESIKKKAEEDSQRREKEQEGAVDLDLDQLQGELERIVQEKQPGFEILANELGLRMNTERKRLNNGLKKMKTSAFKTRNSLNKPERDRSQLEINDFRAMVDDIAPKESSKLVRRVPSTNDQYQPIEMVSQASGESEEGTSLTDEQINAFKWKIPGLQFIREQLSRLLSYFRDRDKFYDDSDEHVEKLSEDNSEKKAFLSKIFHFKDKDKPGIEEKLFIDWRESECLTVVRDQGDCGSCYAFATIALMELTHCLQTGKLVPFSEQYMVDCGKIHIRNNHGCDGSDIRSMAKFIQEWGVELRSNYPYLAKETSCPYDENDKHRAGYMKPTIEVFNYVFEKSHWLDILKSIGPMMALITTPKDFDFYGGMIHDGNNCASDLDSHAMLLVGHGIEDGKEYWLYRNSYGYRWGEDGYFKLSKRANDNCFGPHMFSQFNFMSR